MTMQYIVNQKRTEAYNVSPIFTFYVHAETNSIRLISPNSRNLSIGQYDTIDECKAALDIILSDLAKGVNAYVPSKEHMENVIAEYDQKHLNGYHGHKPIRHGGS